ncbi:hypothetical protein AB0L53_50810 [Nonomuraea sp. NPDC052129]
MSQNLEMIGGRETSGLVTGSPIARVRPAALSPVPYAAEDFGLWQ